MFRHTHYAVFKLPKQEYELPKSANFIHLLLNGSPFQSIDAHRGLVVVGRQEAFEPALAVDFKFGNLLYVKPR